MVKPVTVIRLYGLAIKYNEQLNGLICWLVELSCCSGVVVLISIVVVIVNTVTTINIAVEFVALWSFIGVAIWAM